MLFRDNQVADETEGEADVPGQQAVEDGRKTYTCEFCNKSFKKSSHLKQHVRSHTGWYKRTSVGNGKPLCDDRFSTNENSCFLLVFW